MSCWLVVSTPLKNISQLELLFPIYGKNVPNHQPACNLYSWFGISPFYPPNSVPIPCLGQISLVDGDKYIPINVPLPSGKLTQLWKITFV